MRTTFKIALASVLVFTLAAAAPELNAQARRSTTTTSSTSSSSDNKSATTASRSAASNNASTANRSTSTANRSTGTTANRQSTTSTTTNRENTAARQSSTSNRSTATPSSSTSTQVRRGTSNGNTGSNAGTTTSSQANRSTGTTTESTPNRQVNRNNGTTTNNGNNTGTAARRSSGTSNTETSTTRRQTTTGTTRSTTGGNATTTETPSRRTTTTRSNSTGTTATTTTSQTNQSGTPVRTVRSNANATSSKGLTSAPEASEAVKSTAVRGGVNANRAAAPSVNYSDGREEHGNIRMDKDRNLNRIPPRERDFMTYNRPAAFYATDPHYFGYRVHTLPPRYRRVSYWGRDYYYYDNVYYLRYGDWYVISRPPFGIALDIAIRNATFASVRFSYYHSVYRTFDIVDRNYRTILEQNREIARNNELLARQNSALALNSARALSAYEIASALGLIQSFANINTEYFYEDGVFYVLNKKNRYEVIVPPAGALVNELPEDYDTIVLNGIEYYKVDDTVYRLVLVDGIPALEVLGQMYGSMATKYNYYY